MSPSPDPITFRAEHDAVAFEAVFRAQYVDLCDFVATYVRSADVAHELVQDLFLRLWELQGTPNAPPLTRGYLYTAARNRALRYLRHRRVETRWEYSAAAEVQVERPHAASADEVILHEDLRHAAERAIAELPERCRQVFTLSRHRHLTYQEIAQVLGISVATVETQMWRALKALRAKLGPYLLTLVAILR